VTSKQAGLDVLAIAAHRDDVELTCGGTLAKLARLGRRTGILDLTQALEITNFVALVVGAILAGIVTFFLETLLGLTPPVLSDEPAPAGPESEYR